MIQRIVGSRTVSDEKAPAGALRVLFCLGVPALILWLRRARQRERNGTYTIVGCEGDRVPRPWQLYPDAVDPDVGSPVGAS